jgi:hypothetical protein
VPGRGLSGDRGGDVALQPAMPEVIKTPGRKRTRPEQRVRRPCPNDLWDRVNRLLPYGEAPAAEGVVHRAFAQSHLRGTDSFVHASGAEDVASPARQLLPQSYRGAWTQSDQAVSVPWEGSSGATPRLSAISAANRPRSASRRRRSWAVRLLEACSAGRSNSAQQRAVYSIHHADHDSQSEKGVTGSSLMQLLARVHQPFPSLPPIPSV